MHSFSRSRHAGGKRPPCVATPTTATVGSYGSRGLDAADDRDALVRLPRPLRVEDRDYRIRPVAHDPAHRLAVVGVVREALAEDEDAALPAHACADTPRPGADDGQLDAVVRTRRPATGPRAAAGCRRGRRGRRAARRSSPPRSRGPDSSMQPSITPMRSARAACDDANRLADAARLRELDVDAVRDLGAPRDVGERMAVLVDVDRDRRARLQLAPSVVARFQRLLAVLDAELRELRDRVERFLERPPLVDVDHQRQIRGRSHGSDALDVEAVSASELELESPERRRGLLCPTRHVVGIAEPDRPRGRWAGSGQAEQPVRRRCRAAFPGGRGAPRRAQPSPPARPRSTPGARRCPRARTGRRRRACRGRPRTAAPTRPTRRSGRPAPPRRSP